MRFSTICHLAPLSVCAVWLLSACGGGGSSDRAYSIGGIVSGLATGASVVLQDSGVDNTTVSASGSFGFSTQVAGGAAYGVTILTQPTGQTCTVADGSGIVGDANVTGVRVACTINTYSIAGIVSGLASGAQVTVENNATDPTTVKVNGSFSFATPIPYNGSYAVTVATQRTAQNCTVSEGTGSGVSANVSGVRIACGPSINESVIHAFGIYPIDGIYPSAPIQRRDGNFYGTTSGGGTSGNGTVFKIIPGGIETVLYSFAGGADGAGPSALIQGSDGNFYGTTMFGVGGGSGGGTVFKITPAGVETVLYSFTGGADGFSPDTLVQGSDGNFYGTASGGGSIGNDNNGTVFRITPAGAESTLHQFAGGTNDGDDPSTLIQGSDGNFYGTTRGGGTIGTVFKITPTGVETVLYLFAGGTTDGAYPNALILGNNGDFYGTSSGGGPNDLGTVFKFQVR